MKIVYVRYCRDCGTRFFLRTKGNTTPRNTKWTNLCRSCLQWEL